MWVTRPIYWLKQKTLDSRHEAHHRSEFEMPSVDKQGFYDMHVRFVPPNSMHVEPMHVRYHKGMPTTWVIIPCPEPVCWISLAVARDCWRRHDCLGKPVFGVLAYQAIESCCYPNPYCSCKKLLCADYSWLKKTPNWNMPLTPLVFLHIESIQVNHSWPRTAKTEKIKASVRPWA